MAAILNFLVKLGPWLKRTASAILTFLGIWAADAATKSVTIFVIETAVMTAWSVVIAMVTTGISGLSIHDFISENPFTGFPAAMMTLVVAAFPVKFGVGLVTGYIIFKFTYVKAAMICNRAVRWLLGS